MGMNRRQLLSALVLWIAGGATIWAQSGINAYLYNPPADKYVEKYPYERPDEVTPLHASLDLVGTEAPEGPATLSFRIEGSKGTLHVGEIRVSSLNGSFHTQIDLPRLMPEAGQITWMLKPENGTAINGQTILHWVRFHGHILYRSGQPHSTYISLRPYGWHEPGEIVAPVQEDGSFDLQIPARVYRVMNINGCGYLYDAMERWGWDLDLTRDREEDFTIGRTEIYGVRAFNLSDVPHTIYILFRPSSLSRIRSYLADEKGIPGKAERATMIEATKKSPTVVGPELTAQNVKLWLNDAPLDMLSLTPVIEHDAGGILQINYLAQCMLPKDFQSRFGERSRIRIEVLSREMLHGKTYEDFGQSSIDVKWPL